MKSNLLLPVLGAIAVAAQFADVRIPETERYVASILAEYAGYTDYAPTATAAADARFRETAVPVAAPDAASCSYWMENIKHQGKAAFNTQNNYTVFRNVKAYGAKGDGVADDTAAINLAISSGNRFGPQSRTTSTNTPAVVYFPPGTYLISSSIIDFYYTQIIGNPNCLPIIKATPGFAGLGLIDGNQYTASGLGWGATNVFWRQVRNLVLDMTAVTPTWNVTGIHWPTAQATSLQNIVFKMSSAQGTQHQGTFIEEGSGGWMTDLVFQGGRYGMNHGNQQFTMRNLTFNGCTTAINQLWDWGWTYKGLSINNCGTGIDMSAGGATAQSVSSIVIIDSVFKNTPVGIKTAHGPGSLPPSSGSLVLENVQFTNSRAPVLRTDGTVLLAGGTGTKNVPSWAQGHRYNPSGPQNLLGSNIGSNPRPASLLTGTNFYQRSKPQYANLAASSFLSVRDQGAVGNGVADDTNAVQAALNAAVKANKICFFDSGIYKVTRTVTIPPGSKVVGESFSVIMSSGNFFNAFIRPEPVVRVGTAGQTGVVEWSDMIVSTQGPQAGAILIEWNLASPATTPSGMWDVHTRIGGFIGSQLQGDLCPTTPNKTTTASNYVRKCVGAFMSMHITKSASSLYLENVWIWTADHDIDANFGGKQITVYTGRGLLCESTAGNFWFYGTAVEHHALFEYQFVNTKNIVLGQIQTETAYYQPNPNARIPFAVNATYYDPVFPKQPYTNGTNGVKVPNANGWGLRVINSDNILIYGAGLYSFFNNYATACSDLGNSSVCQSRIASLEKDSSVYLYDLHTVGTRVMLTQNGVDRIDWSDNQSGFSDEVAVFKP